MPPAALLAAAIGRGGPGEIVHGLNSIVNGNALVIVLCLSAKRG